MWYRCAPKTSYLYEFYIYTGKKKTFELGKSFVFHLTKKRFSHIFFGNFFTFASLVRKLADNSLNGIVIVPQSKTLLPKIEKPTKKKSKAEKKQKKLQ